MTTRVTIQSALIAAAIVAVLAITAWRADFGRYATPPSSEPFASAGEWVTTPDGQKVCQLAVSIYRYSAMRSTFCTIAKTTKPAQPHSHDAQDDDAFSNWPSLAFIVPFGRRHAGKEFRGFWVGLAIGALMFSLLFIAVYFYG